MYSYKFAYDNHDDYVHIILQSKVKYTKKELNDILKDVLFKIYDIEEYPPLPCHLNWGEVFYFMTQDPYKEYIKKEYFLTPFTCDEVIRTIDGVDIKDCADNIYCSYYDFDNDKSCLHSRTVNDLIGYGKKCEFFRGVKNG